MSDFHERLAVALVLLGVMLMMAFVSRPWLPLSASDNLPRFESSRPSLPEWPHDHTPSGDQT